MIVKLMGLAVAMAVLYGCGSGGGSSMAGHGGVHEREVVVGGEGEGHGEGARGAAPVAVAPRIDHQRTAVIDGAFDLSALDASRVVASLSLTAGGDDVSQGDTLHGTRVARVLQSEPSQAATLDLLQVTDASSASVAAINHAVGLAAERGARVIQSSFARRYAMPAPGSRYAGVSSRESLSRIVDSNDGLGSLYVVSAGNTGAPLDGGSWPAHGFGEWFEHLLIVGGSTSNGTALHPRSNYPGDDAAFQARFLTAPFEWPAFDIRGTSYSAPHVAGKAAALASTWPHLSARQVGQRLLQTADRSSPLYQETRCGAAGDQNCGRYYLGQGEADLAAAMAPSGELQIPLDDHVGQQSVALDQSGIRLPAAYGSVDTDAMPALAAFDDLGRDYHLDLGALVQPAARHGEEQRRSMHRHVDVMQGQLDHSRHDRGAMRLASRFDGQGHLLSGRLDMAFATADMSLFRHAPDQHSPLSPQLRSGVMPMLVHQPWHAGAGEEALGVEVRRRFGNGLALLSEHGYQPVEGGESQRWHRVGLGLSPLDGLALEAGLSWEPQGQGPEGTGAFASAEAAAAYRHDLRMVYRPSERLSGYAHYQHTRQGGTPLQRDSLMALDPGHAGELELGVEVALARPGHRLALAYRQPTRVQGAFADVSLPVGRTLDGGVIRETHRVDLTPGGRQQDLELGYALPIGRGGRLQLNVMHTLEPGHDREAGARSAGVLNLTWPLD